MPIIKSAKKKLRQDKKREGNNKMYMANYKKAIKKLGTTSKNKKEDLKKVYSIIDKAAKKRIIKKQKAARLKSRATKLLKK